MNNTDMPPIAIAPHNPNGCPVPPVGASLAFIGVASAMGADSVIFGIIGFGTVAVTSGRVLPPVTMSEIGTDTRLWNAPDIGAVYWILQAYAPLNASAGTLTLVIIGAPALVSDMVSLSGVSHSLQFPASVLIVNCIPISPGSEALTTVVYAPTSPGCTASENRDPTTVIADA